MHPSTLRRAAALVVAGLAFAAYPMLRGYGSETGLDGAALYARTAWLVAHLLGMAGFVLITIGLAAIDARSSRWATWGTFAVLPYYGAEAFGLHAIGVRILQTGDADLTVAADLFRYEPIAISIFALGWLAYGAVGGRLLLLAGRTRGLERAGLILTGIGLLTYLPQFFLPPYGRIIHGLVLAGGLLFLASAILSRPSRNGGSPVGRRISQTGSNRG